MYLISMLFQVICEKTKTNQRTHQLVYAVSMVFQVKISMGIMHAQATCKDEGDCHWYDDAK
jgi:hypothetical protein